MEDLKQKRKAAIEVEGRRENFLCKHCNIIYQGVGTETYVPVADVQACKVDKIDWSGRVVYLGVDLSLTNDNTAVAMAAYDEDTEKILADVIAFVPEGRIDEKNRAEKTDYRQFIRVLKCIACGDRTIDYAVVEDFVFNIEEKYGVTVDGIGPEVGERPGGKRISPGASRLYGMRGEAAFKRTASGHQVAG